MPVDASEIVSISMDVIWADVEFNCRGHISARSVLDLAKDIDKQGLQQPITVMPVKNEKYNWRIIAGHRRHMAFKVLKRKLIPCIVNTEITESGALVLNLGENLHRENLNILQEATALERLKLSGFSAHDVSKQLNKSNHWVTIRYLLLELPPEIREEAAAGYITQAQIMDLHRIEGRKGQLEAAAKIKRAKVRGEKAPNIRKPKRNMFKRSPREVDDIFFMQEHIQNAVGNNFGTRCLAWAAGEISDLEIYRDVQEIANKDGVTYSIPYGEKEDAKT